MAKFDKDHALNIMMNGTDEQKRLLVEEISSMLNTKRYGLVWEHGGTDENSPFEAENVVLEYNKGIPYPKHRNDLSLYPDRANGNMLLEGDNYIWLKILEQTHKGKIDVIYIDPPYGTNQKAGKDTGFSYNDRFVDANDSFKNSKWLDFMEKRLKAAYPLLKPGGIVFISVDANHQADTEYLCNDIFGSQNKLCNIAVVNNLKGRSDDAFFATAHEHLICYTNDKSLAVISGFPLTDEQAAEYKFKDEISRYKLVGLKKTGKNCYREDRPNMYYSIYYNPDTADFSLNEQDGYIEILPEINGREGCWRWGRDTFLAKKDTELVAKQQKNDWVVYVKMRDLVDGKERTARPKSIWINPAYDSGNGTAENKDIFGDKVFNNPKPLSYIKDILFISLPPNGTVLDFFAGSGTTAQAVEELNNEDDENRHWILITNNEDQNEDDGDPETGICRDITKPRIDTVITGRRPDGTKYSNGTKGGYSYFQYGFIQRDKHQYERNAYKFFRPYIVDAMIMFKYGVAKEALNEEKMSCLYENNEYRIISLFGEANKDTLEEAIAEYMFFVDEPRKMIIIVPESTASFDELRINNAKRYMTVLYQHSLISTAGYLE